MITSTPTHRDSTYMHSTLSQTENNTISGNTTVPQFNTTTEKPDDLNTVLHQMFDQLKGVDSRIMEIKLSLMKEFSTEIAAIQTQINDRFNTANVNLNQAVSNIQTALQSFKTQQTAENTRLNEKININVAITAEDIKQF